jgi:WD40 repeat protein
MTALWYGTHLVNISSPHLEIMVSSDVKPVDNEFSERLLLPELVCISGKTWTKLSTFVNNSVSGDVTAIALSKNGIYLASAANSDIFIWSTETKQLLFRWGICLPRSHNLTHRGLYFQANLARLPRLLHN